MTKNKKQQPPKSPQPQSKQVATTIAAAPAPQSPKKEEVSDAGIANQKLAAHQSTLFLSFSSQCTPYAEVAAYLLANQNQPNHSTTLKLGLHRNQYSTHTTLIIPAGPFSSDRVELEGKSSILRFLSRQFDGGKHLYESLAPNKQAQIDTFLDSVRASSADPAALVKKTAATAPWPLAKSVKEATVADLVLWDLAQSHGDPKLEAWLKQFSGSSPVLKEAIEKVADALDKSNLLDEHRYLIARELARITGLSIDFVFPLVENKYPKDVNSGDFSIAIPRLRIPGVPADIAKDLESKFVKDARISEVVASNVFLKFTINPTHFRNTLLPRVLRQNTRYGENASGYGKLAIVEFSSPNIAKPFHVGHIRSTIIGNFIQNTLQTNGWTTVSLNYLGDWGKQYGLLAVGYQRYGSEANLLEDPIRHLYDVYVQINKDKEDNKAIDDEARAYFKKMEEGDPEALALWQRFRDLSIVKYREIYGRFGVHFDEYSGESKYSSQQMRSVVDKLKQLGLLTLSDGAQMVDMKEYKLDVAIIEKKDSGGMLYISRDIAAAIHRQKTYKFDSMYYVVGVQQEHHFKQLFKILELMGMPWAERCNHVSFGMIKTKDGNMSTRKGTVVFLEDILNNAQESMLEVMKKNEVKFKQIADPTFVSDLVGITAVMTQDMSARRIKDYAFDWDRVLGFEGDTGPYLQYAHARLCSIERMAGFEVEPDVDLSPLTEPQAMGLLDVIAMYPDVVREVAGSVEPCNTISFTFRLAHAVMIALENMYVMNQPREIAAPRLALYKAARITLGNAMRSLGMVPLERM